MKKKRQKFFSAFMAVILLIFFHWLGILAWPESWLVKTITPLQAGFYDWGLNLADLKNYQKVNEENLRLKNELADLSVDYIKLSELEAENNYLKNELKYLKETKYGFQLVKVIGRLALNDNVLIIDAGQIQGLKPGLAVTVNQGIIIGKISRVEQSRSYVQLLNDTASRLAVGFGDQAGGTNGLLFGKAGNSLVIDLIPQSQEVFENQTVVTSGLEELVPRGLLVGSISQVEQNLGQIFKQARVSPPFSYHNLRVLTVILSD